MSQRIDKLSPKYLLEAGHHFLRSEVINGKEGEKYSCIYCPGLQIVREQGIFISATHIY